MTNHDKPSHLWTLNSDPSPIGGLETYGVKTRRRLHIARHLFGTRWRSRTLIRHACHL